MRTYSYNKEKNVINIPKCWRKINNGIKVWFYRTPGIERSSSDYPVCYADRPKNGELNWIDSNFEILDVAIRVPIFFGLFGYKWILLEKNKEL